MSAKNRIGDLLYYLIIGITATFAISLNSLSATVLEYDIKQILTYSIVAVFIFYFLFYSPKVSLITMGLAVVIGLGLFIYFWRQEFPPEWFLDIRSRGEDIYYFIVGAEPYKDEFGSFLQTLIIFLIGLVVGATLRNNIGFFGVTLLGAITIAIPAVKNWHKSNLGRYLFLFCFVVLFVQQMGFMAAGKDENEIRRTLPKGYSIFTIPIAAVLIGVSLLIPTPSFSGYSVIEELNSAGKSVLENATAGASFYNQGRKKLGGPLVLGTEKVMEVKSELPQYLKGTVMDTYTGSEWYAKNQNAYTYEINPAVSGSHDIAPEGFEKEAVRTRLADIVDLETRSITITPNAESPTKRLYTPPFAENFSITGDEPKLVGDGTGAVWARKNLAPESSYTVDYIPWNYSSEVLQKQWAKAAVGISDPKYLEKYLQLPTTLPTRVRDLAGEITAEETNNYSKLRAIESYLRENYPYTLETQELPPGEDFVDYFLFTEKQGYCVYYATAMVVMARSEGIPARYVEGYVMPPERNSAGNYSVTNQQAHAWVEGYFPEFGWIQFEPTSAYSAPTIARLPEEEELPETETPSPEEAVDPEVTPEAEEALTPETDPETSLPESEAGKEEIEKAEPKKIPPAVTIILTIVLILGLGYLVFIFLKSNHQKKFEKLDCLPNKEKTTGYFGQILGILGSMGQPLKDSETVTDFASRVKGKVPENFDQLAELFSKAAYSNTPITDEESSLMKTSYESLLESYRDSKEDQLKFLVERYILMRF